MTNLRISDDTFTWIAAGLALGSDMTLKLIGLLAIAAESGSSQTVSATRPEFAVVSIKPNRNGCCPVFGVGNGAGGGKYVAADAALYVRRSIQLETPS